MNEEEIKLKSLKELSREDLLEILATIIWNEAIMKEQLKCLKQLLKKDE